MYFVSITRLRIRSWYYLPFFFFYAIRSGNQARVASGNLSVSVFPDTNSAYWTCTVWADEASMRQYIVAGDHLKAMGKLAMWCDEASVVHWLQETPEAPSWQHAHEQMVKLGRRSKVKYPSDAHQQFEIAPPVKRGRA